MKKIQYNVARAKTSELLVRSKVVLNNLTDNPYFPNPSPSLSDWAAAIENLRIKYTASLDRGNVTRSAYKTERIRFNNLMRRMIYYINGVAQQNVESSSLIIVSAGFDFNKDAQAIPAPDYIHGIEAMMTGRSGEILVKAGLCKHARFYEFYISEDGGENFELIKVQQQRNALITGLESGKRYYFKVRASNRSGVSVFSNMAWMFAA